MMDHSGAIEVAEEPALAEEMSMEHPLFLPTML